MVMNLAEGLAHQARTKPDKPAIQFGPRTLRYRELGVLVAGYAGHLVARGVRPGDVVGIALRDTPEHLVALYACARMGAVALPMDWRWTEAEKLVIAQRFHARRVLVEADAPPLANLPCEIADEAAMRAASAAASAVRAHVHDGSAPLLLSLSSGTTGRPKGPMVTHYQFLRRFWTHWIDLGLNGREIYVSATPMYFGGGRTFSMSVLFSGGTLVLFPPPYKPQELVAELAARNATSLFLVPTLLRRLLDLPDGALGPVRRLNLLLSSGAPVTPFERHAIRDRLCRNFHEYYASTEGGGISLLRPEDIDRHEDSVGRPVFGVEVAVFDDAGKALGPDEVGRLAYRSPGVASAFYEDPEATAEAFQNGWYFPGDLGSINAAGYVFLKGRKKDMIIRGGVNIYPVEVESVLLSHAEVAEAAVVGWPSRDMGEEVAAFVSLRPGAKTDPEALRALCQARLAPYKVPKQVFVKAELPKNSAGKLVKPKLVAELPSQ
ncbi:MAG: AMP-binding protein [Alphaproteobacteria bacterium]|nr:AMP-binding protein [Alphaproteobacteria bacterium]